MIILRKLYVNPMIDLSYVFHRFREILRNEYNSFWEDCAFTYNNSNRYIIYYPKGLNVPSIKLSFFSDYPPTKSILGLKCNNSSYYLSNPGDADISGIVHLFVNDCQHYNQNIKMVDNRDKSSMHPDIWKKYTMNDPFFNFPNPKQPSLTKVISSGPATIAFWDDGTKTVVKCQEGDTYDAEKGILYAVLRKCMSNNKDYHNFLTEIDRFKTFVENMKMKEKSE